MSRTGIITHRGLQPSRPGHPFEQSLEALRYQINQGWGLEFDPNFTKDKAVGRSIIALHDKGLTRVTGGKDDRLVKDVPFGEFSQMKLPDGTTIPTLDHVLDLIESHTAGISAMHLKGPFQDSRTSIDLLLAHIAKHPGVVNRMMIFDVRPGEVRYIHEKMPELILAPSISHEADIQRYNGAVSGTLLSVEEAIELGPQGEGLYKWVWGDEWDLSDGKGGTKKLYTKENFDKLHAVGYKIALVTPELHGTSPGLLGGEAHPDAKPVEHLLQRVREIITSGADAVCTDYPEEVQKIIEEIQQ